MVGMNAFDRVTPPKEYKTGIFLEKQITVQTAADITGYNVK